MTQQNKKKEIALGEDFGDVVVKVNGATIDVSAAGYITADSPSGVEWRVATDDKKTAASGVPKIGTQMPDDARRVNHRGAHAPEPPVGAVMSDGTIYAGISPHTGEAMYTTLADVPLTSTFNEAKIYAAAFDAGGHKDWRVPTQTELNVLFNNRAAIGGFNVNGSGPAGGYWSATPYDIWCSWGQRFSDGAQYTTVKGYHSSVRLVRSEAGSSGASAKSNLNKGAKP